MVHQAPNRLNPIRKKRTVSMPGVSVLRLAVMCLSVFAVFLSCASGATTHAQTDTSAKTTVRLLIVEPAPLQAPLLTLNRIGTTNGLLFSVGPVQLSDGTLLSNIDAHLYIRPKGRSDYVILGGRTNVEAKLIYDSSKTLAEQGLAIIGGDSTILDLVNANNDIVDSYGIALFNNNEAESNHAQYVAPVEPPPTTTNPVVIPIINVPLPIIPIPNIPLPRTGGDSATIGSIIGLSSLGVWFFISKRTSKKKIDSIDETTFRN